MTRAQLLRAMPSLKERAKTLIELIGGSYFIFADRPLQMDQKAAALLTPETRELIGRLRAALETVTDWQAETTEAAMRNFAEQNNLKLGAIAQPLRVALTGGTVSPRCAHSNSRVLRRPPPRTRRRGRWSWPMRVSRPAPPAISMCSTRAAR